MTIFERIEQLRALLPEDWTPNPEAECDGHLDPLPLALQMGEALSLSAEEVLGLVD